MAVYGYVGLTTDNLNSVKKDGLFSVAKVSDPEHHPECLFFTKHYPKAVRYADFLAKAFTKDFNTFVAPLVFRFPLQPGMNVSEGEIEGDLPEMRICPSPTAGHPHVLPEQIEYANGGGWEPLVSPEEFFGASAKPLFKPSTKDRICDNCKHFEEDDRHCKKLAVFEVEPSRAEECFFYEYHPHVKKTGRPKPPAAWWYANEARFFSAKAHIDATYQRRIVGKVWWHNLSDDRIAEKISLWGTDDEIKAAKAQGWQIPRSEDKHKKAEQDRIKKEVEENIEKLRDIPGTEETVREALRSYHKVWPSGGPAPPPPSSKPKANFCPNCGARVTGFTCTKCGKELSAPADDYVDTHTPWFPEPDYYKEEEESLHDPMNLTGMTDEEVAEEEKEESLSHEISHDFKNMLEEFDITTPMGFAKVTAVAIIAGLMGFAIGAKIDEDRKKKQA